MRLRNNSYAWLIIAALALGLAGCVTEAGARAERAWYSERGEWKQPLGD